MGDFAMLLGEAGARCAIWFLHLSAFERSKDREPSRSGRRSPEQWCEGIVVGIERLKGIHPSPSGLVLRSRDHFRRDEGFQRPSDLFEVVPQDSDQAVAGQQHAWVAVKKDQEIEVAPMAEEGYAGENILSAFAHHRPGAAGPFRRRNSIMHSIPPPEGIKL
jgi:hypothetical protein